MRRIFPIMVLRIVAVINFNLAIFLKRKNLRCYLIEKISIVTYGNNCTVVFAERLLERLAGWDVQVISRLIKD